MNDTDVLYEAERMARLVGRLLYGKGTAVQAAVLVDLTAIWLRGHRGTTLDSTRAPRAEIMSLHCAAVWNLVHLADEEASA